MKRKRTPHFTLLEVMIATGLTMIILSSLAFFYRQVSLLNSKMDDLQYNQFELLFAENRLSNALTRSIEWQSNLPKNSFYFFTQREIGSPFKVDNMTLLFTFDNCVKLNKEFAYQVLGRLFVDEDNRLTLAMWPSPKRWDEWVEPPLHTEIIMENVENLSFQFYVPPYEESPEEKPPVSEADENPINPEANQLGRQRMNPEPLGTWHSEWKKEYSRLPAMIKIHLKRNGKERETTFAFPLPNAKYHVIYTE